MPRDILVVAISMQNRTLKKYSAHSAFKAGLLVVQMLIAPTCQPQGASVRAEQLPVLQHTKDMEMNVFVPLKERGFLGIWPLKGLKIYM